MVSLHWGVEYVRSVTPEQRVVAERLAAGGLVDVIVGHHAHVVQPVERVGEAVVLFGLGNLLSNQSGACCATGTEDGLLALLELVERPAHPDGQPGFDVTVAAVPTLVERPGVPRGPRPRPARRRRARRSRPRRPRRLPRTDLRRPGSGCRSGLGSG